MRKSMLLASLLAAAAFYIPAHAQQPLNPNFLTGVNPADIKPVDFSKAMTPTNFTGNSFARGSAFPSTFPGGGSASRFYPTINLGSWPPVLPKAPDFSKFFKKS